ncbi:MAG: nicotinamide-nucleotide adenylyltransferase [Candidatus Saliniplasma sp.]
MKGLFIGRFQPFHKGHMAVVEQMAEECDSILIGVGSAQKEREVHDPLSGGERETIIREVLENRLSKPFKIYPIPDINCYPAWAHYVKAILPSFDRVYANSSIVLDLFKETRIETVQVEEIKREEYSGTEIRRRILDGEQWKHLVPDEVADYLEEIDMRELIKPTIGISSETEKKAAHLLTKNNRTISTAESCTGGLIAHRLTNVPGSSMYFLSGLVTYSNEAKIELLGVNEDILKSKGAVSSEVAIQMSEGVRKKIGSDIGLATTGIAGPGGGTEEKPVGTVYMGFSDGKETLTKKYHFSGNRWEVKEQTSEKALRWIIDYFE